MKLRTSDFDYHLPPELIAQTPIEPRDSSRLLVMHRYTDLLEHRQFPHLLEYLRPGAVMLFNQRLVLPARLHGRRSAPGRQGGGQASTPGGRAPRRERSTASPSCD